jgi:prophage regulatory protein
MDFLCIFNSFLCQSSTRYYEKDGIAKSTICLWVSKNKFPRPIKLSSRITVWEEEKINNWMKNF